MYRFEVGIMFLYSSY